MKIFFIFQEVTFQAPKKSYISVNGTFKQQAWKNKILILSQKQKTLADFQSHAWRSKKTHSEEIS